MRLRLTEGHVFLQVAQYVVVVGVTHPLREGGFHPNPVRSDLAMHV